MNYAFKLPTSVVAMGFNFKSISRICRALVVEASRPNVYTAGLIDVS